MKMYGGVEEAKKEIYKNSGGETMSVMTIILKWITVISCSAQRWMDFLTIIFGGRHWYEHC
jgi:hypothetical protein